MGQRGEKKKKGKMKHKWAEKKRRVKAAHIRNQPKMKEGGKFANKSKSKGNFGSKFRSKEGQMAGNGIRRK